ncbi:MAG: acyl carrier protein [Planctomycetes bacterium]|nr:acyl carrier protein [Planctomycetota bacterium]
MERSQILEDVKSILAPFARDAGALASVTEESHILDDLKVNSARLVDAVLAIEDKYDIEIDDDEADSISKVGHAVDIVMKKVG